MPKDEPLDADMTPTCKRMWKVLRSARPVHIDRLVVLIPSFDPAWPARQRQQRLGHYISKINVKLRRHRFVVLPGTPRRTYQLRPAT